MIRFAREGPAENLWVVVLAGGEGRRLSSLTRALYGREVPKQFAVLGGNRSLLQRTLERTLPLVPAARTLVVVGEPHAAIARTQVAPYGPVEIVLQPRNLDTGPGMLLPLARILARDPYACVAFVPSDHHVSRPSALRDAIARAERTCEMRPDRLFLLGAVADSPERDYGWILPDLADEGSAGVFGVRGFVEKPDADRAIAMQREGAFWNTFVTVARASTLRGLAEELLPEHAAAFARYSRSLGGPRETETLRSLYRTMTPANFSRRVLERTGRLGVVSLAGTSWCDLGTPQRVLRVFGPAASAQAALRRRIVPTMDTGRVAATA